MQNRSFSRLTLSDAVDEIGFYVSRLMDLQLAVEALIYFQSLREFMGTGNYRGHHQSSPHTLRRHPGCHVRRLRDDGGWRADQQQY